MTVELTFDFMVEIQFLWKGRLPMALWDEIARQKNEIYRSLEPREDNPDLLTGSKIMSVEARRFDVLFASDPAQNDVADDIRSLIVIVIEELK